MRREKKTSSHRQQKQLYVVQRDSSLPCGRHGADVWEPPRHDFRTAAAAATAAAVADWCDPVESLSSLRPIPETPPAPLAGLPPTDV